MGAFSHLCRVCLEIHRGRCHFAACPFTPTESPNDSPFAPPSQTPTHDNADPVGAAWDEPPAPPPLPVGAAPRHKVIHQMATHDSVDVEEDLDVEPEGAPEIMGRAAPADLTRGDKAAPTWQTPEESAAPRRKPADEPSPTKVCVVCGSLSLDPEFCEHCGAEHPR